MRLLQVKVAKALGMLDFSEEVSYNSSVNSF